MNREDLIKHARRNSHLSFEALLATLREENESRLDSDLVAIAGWAVKLPPTGSLEAAVVYGGAQTPEERAALWQSVARRKEIDLEIFLYHHPEGVTIEQVMDSLNITRPTALKRLNSAGVVRTRIGHHFVNQMKNISRMRHLDVWSVREQIRASSPIDFYSRGQLSKSKGRGKGEPREPKIDPRQSAVVFLKPDTEIELTVRTAPETVWYHRRRGFMGSYTYLECAGDECAACQMPAPNESPATKYRMCRVQLTELEAQGQAEKAQKASKRAPVAAMGRERWLRYREWSTDPEPELGRGVWYRQGKGRDTRYGWMSVAELLREWWKA